MIGWEVGRDPKEFQQGKGNHWIKVKKGYESAIGTILWEETKPHWARTRTE